METNIRKEYGKPSPLLPVQNPLEQFRIWFDEAKLSPVLEPNAMSLATCGKSGIPSVRMVLLKKVDERGFIFFTDYRSAKAKDLEENPRAGLLFYWDVFPRQVRVTGTVSKLDKRESAEYFATRPRGAQLSASASHQSAPIESREALLARWNELDARLKGKDVPLPDSWGGYLLVPESYEFYQGAEDRLHDRLSYVKAQGDRWNVARLSP